jgi:type III secretion protein Q
MNALPSIEDSLPRISPKAAALSSLYGLGPLDRTIDGIAWRFRWRHLDESFVGVEVILRLGEAQLELVFEDLSPFGSATDVTRLALPPALRAAYLSGIGASVWRVLEALTSCTVHIVSVQPNVTADLTAQCIGFEIVRAPDGPATRGFVRPLDANAQSLLEEVSGRALPRAAARDDLPVPWAAVVGSTKLPLVEVRALEQHDIVIVDDAAYTADALECSLTVGRSRRHAGRVSVQMGQVDVIDDIPVSLRFELAQWQAPLAEISRLAPGSVIELGRPVDSHIITVWVEQRCIGNGQLVAVGERLGVRLLNVFPASVEEQGG